MKYRRLDADGDFSFGRGLGDFHVDTPDAVAQAALTRLRLWAGEWFLDLSEGTPYNTRVLGKFSEQSRDPTIRARVLETRGLNSIESYSSGINPDTRRFEVAVSINTIYGVAEIRGEPL